MASLKWLVHSACHVILGNPTKEETTKSNSNNNMVLGLSHKTCPNSLSSSAITAFEMPLHYPRYSKADYEKMEEWRLDLLLAQYGLSFEGALEAKREFAKGAFLWPDQY